MNDLFAGLISSKTRIRLSCAFSSTLHRIFDARQESDYKEFVRFTNDDAAEYLRMAEEFLRGVKAYIAESKSN